MAYGCETFVIKKADEMILLYLLQKVNYGNCMLLDYVQNENILE